MCDGCWFGSSGCAGAEKAYALAPVHDQTKGMQHLTGGSISKEDARISVAYCAEQMKTEPDCSKRFVGVSMKDGQCWCAKKNDNCDNFVDFTSYMGYFFKSQERSENISEAGGEEAVEGALVVRSDRRLSTKCV